MFEDDYFRITEQGIDFLRNKYCYAHYNHDEILNITVTRGHFIDRWFLSLIIGIIFVLVIVLILVKYLPFYQINNYANFAPVTIKEYLSIYVSLLFPLLIGIILIFQSFRKSIVLIIQLKNKRKRFSLNKFEKNAEVDDLIYFIEKKYPNKLNNILSL